MQIDMITTDVLFYFDNVKKFFSFTESSNLEFCTYSKSNRKFYIYRSTFCHVIVQQYYTIVIIQPLYSPEPIPSTILLIIVIFSLPSFIFVLYHLLTTRALFHALNNHFIILLLINNGIQTVTDVPVQLASFYTGIVWPPTTSYCIFFYFIDYYLFTTCFLLLTWASFERHILIFHIQFYNTRFQRLVGHYIPLSFYCVYPFVYYIVFLLFYPCENYYDVNIAYCALPCYLSSSNLMALYEEIVHGYAPIALTFILDTSLIIRVLRQKRRMNRELLWTKNLKMTIQLLSVCCLFFITNGGYFLIQLGQLLWDRNFGVNAANWMYPLSMCLPPLMSYAALPSLPNFKQKLTRLISGRHRRAVTPANTIQVRTARFNHT